MGSGDSYVSLFLDSAIGKGGDPMGALTLFFLFLARFLPIMGLAPFLARACPHSGESRIWDLHVCCLSPHSSQSDNDYGRL